MKSILTNTILILLVRVFLGGLFIVASLDKIADPAAFAASILNYKIVGPTLAMVIATILPSLELLCGLSLILGLYPRTSALFITFMLVGFTILIISALLRGLDISCGCFTQDPNVGKIGYIKILENVGMIMLGVLLLFVQNYGITLTQFFPQQKNAPSDKI
ncbi:MAG: MauE/DoxX family redox-associated membrane protein [Bacteroidota bacterium]